MYEKRDQPPQTNQQIQSSRIEVHLKKNTYTHLKLTLTLKTIEYRPNINYFSYFHIYHLAIYFHRYFDINIFFYILHMNHLLINFDIYNALSIHFLQTQMSAYTQSGKQ